MRRPGCVIQLPNHLTSLVLNCTENVAFVGLLGMPGARPYDVRLPQLKSLAVGFATIFWTFGSSVRLRGIERWASLSERWSCKRCRITRLPYEDALWFQENLGTFDVSADFDLGVPHVSPMDVPGGPI